MRETTVIRFDYRGRHVLVTGGTSGIGQAIAVAYRDAGANVTITGRRPSRAEYEIDLDGFDYLQMEANNREHVAAIAKRVSVLDVLVNNAGESAPGGHERRFEPDVFENTVNIILFGPYRLAHALRPVLARSDLTGGASVVNIASLASYFGMDAVPGYGAAKAGIVQLTKTLAIAWAADNIRVNAIAPGNTKTRMFTPVMDIPAVIDPLVARTPLGRLAEVEEMPGAVMFLTSPQASFITGQTLPVCGGYSIF